MMCFFSLSLPTVVDVVHAHQSFQTSVSRVKTPLKVFIVRLKSRNLQPPPPPPNRIKGISQSSC